MQQRGRTVSSPLPSSISTSFDPLEQEADEVASAIETSSEAPVDVEQQAGTGLALHRQTLTPTFGPVQPQPQSKPPLTLQIPLSPYQAGPLPPLPQLTTPAILKTVPAACDHPAALTWADFAGKVPKKSGGFSAKTDFHYELAAIGSVTIVKAFFDSASSWVETKFANPSNPALSGCDKLIGSCQAFFTAQAKAGKTGGNFSPNPPGRAAQQCPASAQLDPKVTANIFGDCTSVIGQHCADVAATESERLLRHEQRHYDLACALASKGSLAIMGGGAPADTLKSVRSVSASQTLKYDNETAHGCKAAPQAAWSRDIDAGLPSVKLP